MNKACWLCDGKYYAKDLCNKHYQRSKTGKPLVSQKEFFKICNPPKDGIGKIPLTNNQVAIVDEEDYEDMIKHNWCAAWDNHTKSYYALRTKVSNGRKTVRMHREIMNTPKNMETDHINHDTLDNRKQNLRIVTCSQNHMNQRLKPCTSKYKGVSLDEKAKKWKAQINFKGKNRHLRYLDEEEDAAIYYDVAAQLFFGEHAYLNFPKLS